MKTFRCECGHRLFFENTQCIRCQRALAYAPDVQRIVTVEEDGERVRSPSLAGRSYRHCENRLRHGACNWLVPEQDGQWLCHSCRLNLVIPNLDLEGNIELWKMFEQGKRHLVYSLTLLRLPVRPKVPGDDTPPGLGFKLMQDQPQQPVITGHAMGVITINLNEINSVSRERARVRLGEDYRTVLGHLRHEVGHYYWDVLIKDSTHLARCRELFGDDRADYSAALQQHYNQPATTDWSDHYISHYASSHPWEDWAETWAHYLHILDTIQTAKDFGMVSDIHGPAARPHGDEFDALVDEWTDMSLALNALNRSMGQPDAYPFAIAPPVREKLRFVSNVVAQHRKV